MRTAVTMWVGVFGGLMQPSLTCKVHELVNIHKDFSKQFRCDYLVTC